MSAEPIAGRPAPQVRAEPHDAMRVWTVSGRAAAGGEADEAPPSHSATLSKGGGDAQSCHSRLMRTTQRLAQIGPSILGRSADMKPIPTRSSSRKSRNFPRDRYNSVTRARVKFSPHIREELLCTMSTFRPHNPAPL